MKIRVSLFIILICGAAQGVNPGTGRYLDPNCALVQQLYEVAAIQSPAWQTQDTLRGIDVDSPNYRYPGKAMVLSLLVPGAGQLYVRQLKKTALFLGVEVLAVWALRSYSQRGKDSTEAYEEFADDHWDFEHWLFTAHLYQTDPWGKGKDQIYVGTDGSHQLEFFVDMDGDGRPEVYGNTKEDSERIYQLLADPDTSDFVYVKKNNAYYENVGKYNQFFSGWDDATPEAEIDSSRKSGWIALSDHRSQYIDMRAVANDLKSVATYAVSALMF
ncbi:MAG: DUF5683 domain-containing protein, partial [Candidatus Neomarinimicrobiota bacterium]